MARSGGERPLRVVHVIGGLELGGAETLLYRLATHALPGVEQEVICLGEPDWYSGRLAEQGITVHHLGMNSPASTLGAVRELRKLLRTGRADVVQSWMYLANVLSALVAKRQTPVVWGIHNSSLEHAGLPSRLCARLGGAGVKRLASFVINCSQRSSELHSRLGYGAVSNAVIHNGYDEFAFSPDAAARAATRGSLGLNSETFIVGSVARWHPQKDIPNLLRAVRLAADQGVPLRCLLIGRGLAAGNREVSAAIEASGCGELVIPLGPRSDVPDLARALDLHVLASSGGEAFPNVVAETMLSGTPNAVTDIGDCALMLGETGWVVPARDPSRLADAIVSAWGESAEQPQLWEQRRERARARIVDNFTFEKMAEAYCDVWRRVAHAQN
jgi:glycosyltransferase involved in cell wall biosynthesis